MFVETGGGSHVGLERALESADKIFVLQAFCIERVFREDSVAEFASTSRMLWADCVEEVKGISPGDEGEAEVIVNVGLKQLTRRRVFTHPGSLLVVIIAQLLGRVETSSFRITHEYEPIREAIVLHSFDKEQRPVHLVEDVVRRYKTQLQCALWRSFTRPSNVRKKML
jgi:hypothetical protein